MQPLKSRPLISLALLVILAVLVPAGMVMIILVLLMQALPSWPAYATLVFLLGLGSALITVHLLRRWGPTLRQRLLEGESRTALLQLTAISTTLTLALVGFATLVPVLVELLTLITDR
jgi:hypothetical protein